LKGAPLTRGQLLPGDRYVLSEDRYHFFRECLQCHNETEHIESARLGVPKAKKCEICNGELRCKTPPEPVFLPLPKRCRCRRTVVITDAIEQVNKGVAVNLWKAKKKSIEVDFDHIWLPQQRQVPRIDLITEADIERAYIDGNKESIQTIEEIHLMHMLERAKLIKPFQDDPTGGRLIFPFQPDQRTRGGR
jgi:hypothetical protein